MRVPEPQVTKGSKEHWQMMLTYSRAFLQVSWSLVSVSWSLFLFQMDLQTGLVWLFLHYVYFNKNVCFFIESQTLWGWRPGGGFWTFPVQLFPSLYCYNTIPMFPTCVSVSLCTKGICENFLIHKNYVNLLMFLGFINKFHRGGQRQLKNFGIMSFSVGY